VTDATQKEDLEAFRAEAREWVAANFPPSLKGGMGALGENAAATGDVKLWKQRLADKGWGCPTWPVEYGGGGVSQAAARVLKQEMDRAGAWSPYNDLIAVNMVGPTILEYGTEEQKRQHVPPIARGELRWCLGYSEPGAGSDLASLTTRAEDAGDHWVVNGSKMWTSGAEVANWCGALVRTDPQAKKHDGISFLLIDMDQPGVTTKPIRLIAGQSPFSETFFDNARAEKYNLLGRLNDGWNVGKRLLMHERAGQTAAAPLGGPKRTILDLAREYVGLDADGRLSDRDLRNRLADNQLQAKAHALTIARVQAEARGNLNPGTTASVLKNSATRIAQAQSELTIEIMGSQGLGWEGEGFHPDELEAARSWLHGKSMSIYGGSTEIQNNIVAKRILGLPDMTKST
jgi:alkylation response protein AidB-like acyl-CoA dehydrogenase